jgi:spore maturation protein CgeB
MVLFHILRTLFKNGKKVLIAGSNWKSSFPDCDFIQEHCENPLDIFRQSAITLHNNTHGIGIHSRVLEAMAAGSFIMMHVSPCSHLPGGIDSSFEPELHYGLYSANNLAEKVEYWLAHSSQRQKATKDCHNILRARHLWRHRASQILGDLA